MDRSELLVMVIKKVDELGIPEADKPLMVIVLMGITKYADWPVEVTVAIAQQMSAASQSVAREIALGTALQMLINEASATG